ncbi:MAG: DsbE family thiol:disulfide interchange protein [Pseudomonadota bacterium]
MKRLFFALPLAVVAAIGGFLLWGLNPDRDPSVLPSVLIDEPAPAFALPAIEGVGVPGLSRNDLAGGSGPVLINVFASWCIPCRAEHGVLTDMVERDGVVLYGINYKDKPAEARAWLDELGNPYDRIGSDYDGRAGIEWGLTGVPETFVVDAGGTVRLRHVGPIVSDDQRKRVLEALEAARTVAQGAEAS